MVSVTLVGVDQPGTSGAVAASASQTPTIPAASLRTVFAERFTKEDRRDWPNDPQGTAWMIDGAYRVFARDPSQFVAIGAPGVGPFRDVVVTATLRKVGGPTGGGYGLIVRDRGPGPRDGINQGGRYYVFETGDEGTVGIWRRETDRWVDLQSWTQSEAVNRDGATNQLSVWAVDSRLSFRVNGVQVASLDDSVLGEGSVGIFVGGDLNEVVVDEYSIQVPE
jgi:hypothetical protein